jgi:hypothetical protein
MCELGKLFEMMMAAFDADCVSSRHGHPAGGELLIQRREFTSSCRNTEKLTTRGTLPWSVRKIEWHVCRPWGLVLSPIVVPHHTVSKTATALVRKYYRSIFSVGNKISKSYFVEALQSGERLL